MSQRIKFDFEIVNCLGLLFAIITKRDFELLTKHNICRYINIKNYIVGGETIAQYFTNFNHNLAKLV